MFEAQGGLCAICHKPQTTRKLAVDHDHESGLIRGLLCTRCNCDIGLLEKLHTNLGPYVDYMNKFGYKITMGR